DEARKEGWSAVRHLLLAIEVLSPGSGRGDRIVKRQLYQREGVPLYWIIDIEAKAVEVWTPRARQARIEREMLTWHPAGASEPFTLPLAKLFRPV
ncbi:MAG TPA: Uma2 family endonuclease, partial [Dehalococcoidia bacterium]|nr:Uma2 family endonuclease [Dehalococcoidia bacterium]